MGSIREGRFPVSVDREEIYYLPVGNRIYKFILGEDPTQSRVYVREIPLDSNGLYKEEEARYYRSYDEPTVEQHIEIQRELFNLRYYKNEAEALQYGIKLIKGDIALLNERRWLFERKLKELLENECNGS